MSDSIVQALGQLNLSVSRVLDEFEIESRKRKRLVKPIVGVSPVRPPDSVNPIPEKPRVQSPTNFPPKSRSTKYSPPPEVEEATKIESRRWMIGGLLLVAAMILGVFAVGAVLGVEMFGAVVLDYFSSSQLFGSSCLGLFQGWAG